MAKQLRSFYRPHKRVTFDNDLVNPYTGEVSYPPSLTKQEFVRESDINNVIKQYSATGTLTHISAKAAQGAYQDLPDGQDFQQAMNIVLEGQNAFASLPAKVRERFGHNPESFLAFLADPQNREEAIRLGLVTPPPVAEAPKTPAEAKSE